MLVLRTRERMSWGYGMNSWGYDASLKSHHLILCCAP